MWVVNVGNVGISFNSLFEIHDKRRSDLRRRPNLSILFLRFCIMPSRAEATRFITFQFSFWDSQLFQLLYPVAPASYLFQFSFWDSAVGLLVDSAEISFDFQFSFWDSAIETTVNACTANGWVISFNSLFEILINSSGVASSSLSTFNSLFEIRMAATSIQSSSLASLTFNSLFEIRQGQSVQGSSVSSRTFNSLFEIPEFGFRKETAIDIPFNSLFEILNISDPGVWRHLFDRFQFSFWDSED